MRTFLAGSLFTLISAGILSRGGNGGNADIKAALADSANFTTIEWLDSATRSYGTVVEGEKVNVSFRFRNTGNSPLVIGRVIPSCGCTVAEQPQKPIGPGQEGAIRATFNSEGRVGINHKTLSMNANTKGVQNYALKFVVQVDKKPS